MQCVTLLCTVFLCDLLRFYMYLFPGRVLCLSWHPNNNVLVTGASDSTVRVYNTKSGKNPTIILLKRFLIPINILLNFLNECLD